MTIDTNDMFGCYRAERTRAALAKRFLVKLLQHATAADTREYFSTTKHYIKLAELDIYLLIT